MRDYKLTEQPWCATVNRYNDRVTGPGGRHRQTSNQAMIDQLLAAVKECKQSGRFPALHAMLLLTSDTVASFFLTRCYASVVYATALYLIVAILCYIKMAKEIELAFGTEAFLDIFCTIGSPTGKGTNFPGS